MIQLSFCSVEEDQIYNQMIAAIFAECGAPGRPGNGVLVQRRQHPL